MASVFFRQDLKKHKHFPAGFRIELFLKRVDVSGAEFERRLTAFGSATYDFDDASDEEAAKAALEGGAADGAAERRRKSSIGFRQLGS